jgi:hypothetical protein
MNIDERAAKHIRQAEISRTELQMTKLPNEFQNEHWQLRRRLDGHLFLFDRRRFGAAHPLTKEEEYFYGWWEWQRQNFDNINEWTALVGRWIDDLAESRGLPK